MNDSIKPLRVLLSEGSSTSAREAITILGLSGHRVGGMRRDLMREGWRLLRGSALYAASREELTPVQSDWLSAVPLALTAALLLAAPSLVNVLARSGFGAHLLDIDSVRRIESTEFG
jgi:hypothetical protein